MKTIEQLKAELETARQQVLEIEKQIIEMADGFIYHICVLSYGSSNWSTCANPFTIQELCYQYGDGYDGLVKVYTNNPNLEVEDQGCLEVLSLEELPDNKRDVSMTEAITHFITEGILEEEKKGRVRRVYKKF